MHRIDSAGATVDNLFTDGNPGTGTPATTVDDDWLNAVQEELANAIVAAGIALVKGTNNQLAAALALLAPLADAAFTGNPTAPTQALGNNSTRLANTAFVQAAIAALVDSSPGTLDTLNELAAALGDDPNFATTVMNALAAKLALTGGTLTGALTLHADPTDDLHAAPKQYVDAAVRRRSTKGPFAMTQGATAETAHGLSWTPAEATVNLICIATEGGFSVGQRVAYDMQFWATSNEGGVQTWWDDTNYGYLVGWGSSVLFDRSGSGQFFTLTPAKWNFEIVLDE